MAQPPVDPSRTLKPPVAREPIPDFVDEILSLPDYISPTHWLLMAMDLVLGFNPAEKAAEWVAGDWQGVATNASAFRNLAAFERELSTSVATSTRDAQANWEGNAAAAAGRYFHGLAESLDEHATALATLATQYDATALGVAGFGKAIVSAVEMLGDILFDIAVNSAAAAALSETGVAVVIGGAIDGYLAYKAVHKWMEIVDLHGKIIAAAEGLFGVVTGEMATLHGLTRTPVPGAAYDNALVG